MLRSARDVMSSGDLGSIVDFAIEANRTVVAATEDLGEIKRHLRMLAEARRQVDPAMTTVRFEGHLGTALVVIPTKPLVRARKGMHLGDLRRSLSAELYESLFEERIVVEPVGDYITASARLNPSQRFVVERYVEIVPATSRVNLPE